jgi:molybdate transport system ATP-binding protein
MSFDISLRHRIGGRDVALDLHSSAHLVAITGPSGAGKTTLLNCIAGLIRPDGGRVAIAGEVLFDAAAGVNLPPERRRAGYVFQDLRLFPHLTVGGNLAYGERLAPVQDRWMGQGEVADLLGIGHLLGRAPDTLSGGEARRVAIGRALLAAPRFLLLDEPTASLDPARAEELRALLERLRDSLRLPILLVSHDAAEVERLAGHVVSLA